MIKSIVSKVTGLAAAGIIALGLFVIAPANSAHAQERPDFQRDYTGLELAYSAMQLWSENMGNRLMFVDEILEALDEWAVKLDSYDASAEQAAELAQARSEFETALNTAKSEYEQGVAIIAAGNGFDGSGEVTDPEAARDTISTARGHFAEAREISTDAVQELRNDMEGIREDLEQIIENR